MLICNDCADCGDGTGSAVCLDCRDCSDHGGSAENAESPEFAGFSVAIRASARRLLYRL